MPSCFVPNCKNSDKLKKTGISYHSFPKGLKVKWLKAIGRDEKTFIIQQRVCSDHFLAEDYENIGLLKKLKPNVIPSVNFPTPRPILEASKSQAIPETCRSANKMLAQYGGQPGSDNRLHVPMILKEERDESDVSDVLNECTWSIFIDLFQLQAEPVQESFKASAQVPIVDDCHVESQPVQPQAPIQNVASENRVVDTPLPDQIKTVIPQVLPTLKSPYMLVLTPHGSMSFGYTNSNVAASIESLQLDHPYTIPPPSSQPKASNPPLGCISAAGIQAGSNPSRGIPMVAPWAGPCPQLLVPSKSTVGTAQTASIPPVPRSSSPEFISTDATISTIFDPATSMMNQNLRVPDPLALESTCAAAELIPRTVIPSVRSKAAPISNPEISQTGPNHWSRSISTQTYFEELQFSGTRPLIMNQEEQPSFLNQAYSRLPTIRYPGDIKGSDLTTGSDVHNVWKVCQETVRKKTLQIKTARQSRRRLDNKIRSLLQVIRTFKDNNLVAEDIADTLEKGVSNLLSSSDNKAE